MSLIEAQLKEGKVDQNAIMQEISGIATEITEEFLDTGLFGADISVLEGQLGEGFKYSPEQREAYNLLKDIQGFGVLDWSDKTWGYIKEGTKIAGMIVVGIAVGLATGGAGFAAMAASAGTTVGLGATASGIIATGLVGGAAMTATGAMMNGTGFDEGEFLNTYGTDFMVNAVGFGTGKALNIARSAYLAKYGGESASLGRKLLASGGEMVTDIGIGAGMDVSKIAIDKGMRFDAAAKYYAENPNEWVMSIVMPGVFGGLDLAGTAGAFGFLKNSKFLKNFFKTAFNSDLHSMDQAMSNMTVNRSLLSKDLDLLGKNWDELLQAKNIDDIVKQLPADRQAKFRENFDSYIEGQNNIYEISKVALDDALVKNNEFFGTNRTVRVIQGQEPIHAKGNDIIDTGNKLSSIKSTKEKSNKTSKKIMKKLDDIADNLMRKYSPANIQKILQKKGIDMTKSKNSVIRSGGYLMNFQKFFEVRSIESLSPRNIRDFVTAYENGGKLFLKLIGYPNKSRIMIDQNYLNWKSRIKNELNEIRPGDIIYSRFIDKKTGKLIKYKPIAKKNGDLYIKNENGKTEIISPKDIVEVKRNIKIGKGLGGVVKNQDVVKSLWANGLTSDIIQGTIGDCYFLSSLQGMKKLEGFDNILKSRIKIHKNGWKVAISDYKGKNHYYSISRGELAKWKLGQTKKGKVPVITSNEGDLILNLAYQRHRENFSVWKKAKNDLHIEGGNSYEVFKAFGIKDVKIIPQRVIMKNGRPSPPHSALLGKTFATKIKNNKAVIKIDGKTYSLQKSSLEKRIVELGGKKYEVIDKGLGIEIDGKIYRFRTNAKEKFKADINGKIREINAKDCYRRIDLKDIDIKYKFLEKHLQNLNTKKNIVYLGSKQKKGKTDKHIYKTVDHKGKKVELFHNHAYFISDVNSKMNTCTIINPHNTNGEKYIMKIEDVIESFPRIDFGKIN